MNIQLRSEIKWKRWEKTTTCSLFIGWKACGDDNSNLINIWFAVQCQEWLKMCIVHGCLIRLHGWWKGFLLLLRQLANGLVLSRYSKHVRVPTTLQWQNSIYSFPNWSLITSLEWCDLNKFNIAENLSNLSKCIVIFQYRKTIRYFYCPILTN